MEVSLDVSQLISGAIKFDLDWVAQNWQQNGCDLWEEVQSNDFFWNRFNFHRALVLGAQFASSMGDNSTAQTYQAAAAAIKAVLRQHWNGQFVFESANRQKDAAVIGAFNEGYVEGGDFGPLSHEVASTIQVYNQLFCDTFTINQQDNQYRVPGVLYGRYEGDHYAGGNPWILTTASLGELFYRGASATLEAATLPEPEAYKVWQNILNIPQSQVDTLSHIQFARLLVSAGDSVFNRLAYHTAGDNFHLSEQLDRNTGRQRSAYDLTWNYANVLKAWTYRRDRKSVV